MQIKPSGTHYSTPSLPTGSTGSGPTSASLPSSGITSAGLSAHPQSASFAEHLRGLGTALQTAMPEIGTGTTNLPANQADMVDVLETTDLRDSMLAKSQSKDELRDTFQDFVGQTFFSEMIKSLRTTQKGAAYFNGGRAEEIFQGQFDQMMTEHLSDASAQSISDPMFKLFQLGRNQ